MTRFVYAGPEDEVSIFGATFRRGEPVEVAEPRAAAKLAAHPEFTVSGAETVSKAGTAPNSPALAALTERVADTIAGARRRRRGDDADPQ